MGYPCCGDDVVVQLQPFRVTVVDHLGVKLSLGQNVVCECCMESQSSQILPPSQIGSIRVRGVRPLYR